MGRHLPLAFFGSLVLGTARLRLLGLALGALLSLGLLFTSVSAALPSSKE